MHSKENTIRLDIGCGSNKKEGTIGLDVVAGPGVDHVVDFTSDALPFSDESVGYIFSSHCLEHISYPFPLFQEISRVCKEGAQLEFWTPYAWSNSAFVYDHKTFYNEDHYLHMCLWHSNIWKPILGKQWVLQDIVYVIEPSILIDLVNHKVDLDFAIRYHKGVVKEFAVMLEVWSDYSETEKQPKRWYSTSRDAVRHPLKLIRDPRLPISDNEINKAIQYTNTSIHKQKKHITFSELGFLTKRFYTEIRNNGIRTAFEKSTKYLNYRFRA